MEERALYVPDADGYVGTILTQGGWHPDQANGGTVLALLGHCLEDVPTLTPMVLSRLTVDLVRPVPLGRPLQVRSNLLREGKKIQLVELLLLDEDVVHARATALRLRVADVDSDEVPSTTTDHRPADGLAPPDAGIRHRGVDGAPGFIDGVDLRRSPLTDGSGTGAWIRLDVPVVAGEPIRETSRLTVAFDFANLIGVTTHPTQLTMINPDVTAHVLRPPTDEWIAIVGDTRFETDLGRGLSTATLSDSAGVFAVVSLSQLLQRR